jgi:uncharacterized damage-inducible protein DinB
MRVADIRFLFAYDRWATQRVLAVLDGIPDDVWAAETAIDERGLGAILVHQLGASQRWRHSFQQDGLEPEPEREPLLTVDELRARWVAEWDAVDAWLPTLTDGFLDFVPGDVEGTGAAPGVPIWQMLAHVVNHGTQHRSEAGALLTEAGRSPGDLDMIDFADEAGRPA